MHVLEDKHDVYIGRSKTSIWGNPYHVRRDGSRLQVLALYEKWILDQPELLERAKRELRGKVLGCWCRPLVCHGDVLVRLIENG